MTLRKTHKTWHKAKETAEKLKRINEERFADSNLYKLFVDSVLGFDSGLIPVAEEQEPEVMEFD
jgi:hypothetical protein